MTARVLESLRGIDLAVFVAVVGGCLQVAQVCEQTGYSAARVRGSLKKLAGERLVVRKDYYNWELAESGHNLFTGLVVDYCEAHKMIVSVAAETHKMIASNGRHNGEAHKMIALSAQNDRFSPSFMHVNDHACMDEEMDQLRDELQAIGFDRPGRWLQKENVSLELVSGWLAYVKDSSGIRNKPGFVRRQVESGERPNLVKAKRKGVPAEYEHLVRR